jgi:hypothetical protein
MRPSESLKVAGRPIAYYPKLAKPLGSVNAAILFGHFFYWHDKTENPLGVYRTAEEIEDETGLSVQEQRTARSKLKERGVLIETEKRIEHRIYYKLDLNAFDDLMLQHSGSEESTAVIRTEDLTEDLTVNTPLPPNTADGGNGLNADAFVPAGAGTGKQGEDGVLQEETTVTPALKTNRAGGNTRRSRYNQVPCQDIADCYNEILGGCLPRVQLLSEARKRAIAARWFEVMGTKAPNGKVRFENAEDGVKWFASVFRKITKNAFWMGDNQSGFAVNFDWIFKPTNFLKVLEWHPPRS